jgi:hypothetical protein
LKLKYLVRSLAQQALSVGVGADQSVDLAALVKSLLMAGFLGNG